MKYDIKIAVAISASCLIGNLHAKDAPFPESFRGLSLTESVYACLVYFHNAVNFELSALQMQPNNTSFQKALRSLVRMKTSVLAISSDDIPEERRQIAEGMLGLKVEEESREMMNYCVAVSNTAEEKMGQKIRGWVDEHVEEELRRQLRSVGSRSWRKPPR